tara:strand:+ start:2587 stop:2946 length:360 start_codon:yes stop_codon:yes gene_type:complete
MAKWYQICFEVDELSGGLAFDFHYQFEKDNIYISPHVKLAGHAKVAQLESKPLAQRYLERCLPIFQKRYGDSVELTIIECQSSPYCKKTLTRIQSDSLLVKARLTQNIMVPNKKPILDN